MCFRINPTYGYPEIDVGPVPREAVDGWACTFYRADDPLFGVRGAKGTLRDIARGGRLLLRALRELPR